MKDGNRDPPVDVPVAVMNTITHGNQTATTDALGNTAHTEYDSAGNVIAQWGATYPVAHTYDAASRMTSMGVLGSYFDIIHL